MNELTSITIKRLQATCIALFLIGFANDTLFSQATDQQLLEFTRDRQKHQRVTQYPVKMEWPMIFACSAPIRNENTIAPTSPHHDKALMVYCDEKSLASMWDPYAKFEEGSIIIKQKFAPANMDKIELFTGMLKREQGYAPEVGDWEFFTISGDATQVTARGKLESCISCHKGYPDSDFVTKEYSASALATEKRISVYVRGAWQNNDRPVCNGACETVFLPASLAMTRGKSLSRTEAKLAYLRKASEARQTGAPKTNSNSNFQSNSYQLPEKAIPEDLSSVGGPKLRYEPQLNKNTLGYWTEVDDSASWQIAFEKPGRYQVSVYQGCGTGNGGSQVAVSMENQQLEFTVVDTGGFQKFRWLEIGELTIDAAGKKELIVRPKTKAANAVLDLQQIRLKRIADR